MNDDTVRYIIIIVVILLVVGYLKYGQTSLIYEKASDEKFHLVRDLPDKEAAAEMMSEIKKRLQQLIDYCLTSDPSNPNIKLMKQRFKPQNIQEVDIETDSGTSYTIDKGKELHICLRSKEDARLHQLNLLLFVSIHELAHIMSSSYGHNEEFARNFTYLLKNASKIGIYTPIDYSKNPVKYCGLDVDASPLF